MMMPLPVPAYLEEGFWGLIVRLAEENMCSTAEMCQWLGLPRMGSTTATSLVAVAELTGVDPDTLLAMGFSENDEQRLGGNVLPSQLFRKTEMAFCPHCLVEKPFLRRIWDCAVIRGCPVHRVELRTTCPDCGKKQGWERLHLRDCSCGADLTSGQTEHAEFKGATLIYQRLGLECPGSELPAVFADVTLPDLIELLTFLGRADVMLANGNPDQLHPAKHGALGKMLDRGGQLLLQWPESLSRLAWQIRSARGQGNSRNEGLQEQYGYLYRFVRRSRKKSFGKALLAAFAEHLATRPDGDFRWRLPLEEGESLDDYVEARKVASALGVGWRSIQTLRKMGAAKVQLRMGPTGRSKLVRRADVDAVARRLNSLISYTEVELRLGMTTGGTRVASLASGGLLTHRPSYHDARNERGAFEREEVEALLKNLVAHATEVPPSDPISFTSTARRIAVKGSGSFPDLVRAILDGKLRPYISKPEAIGFNRLSFERSEAVAVVDDLLAPISEETLNFSEAAAALSVFFSVVQGLVDAQLLPPPTRRGKSKILSTKAVHEFRDRYISSRDVAKVAEVEIAVAEKMVEEAGIKRIATIQVAGKRPWVYYDRCEVSTVIRT